MHKTFPREMTKPEVFKMSNTMLSKKFNLTLYKIRQFKSQIEYQLQLPPEQSLIPAEHFDALKEVVDDGVIVTANGRQFKTSNLKLDKKEYQAALAALRWEKDGLAGDLERERQKTKLVENEVLDLKWQNEDLKGDLKIAQKRITELEAKLAEVENRP